MAFGFFLVGGPDPIIQRRMQDVAMERFSNGEAGIRQRGGIDCFAECDSKSNQGTLVTSPAVRVTEEEGWMPAGDNGSWKGLKRRGARIEGRKTESLACMKSAPHTEAE